MDKEYKTKIDEPSMMCCETCDEYIVFGNEDFDGICLINYDGVQKGHYCVCYCNILEGII